ncbi:MAG: carbamoyltransferase HypF, partial [Chloroflexi bacterium]
MQTSSVQATSPARGASAHVRRRLRVRGVVQGVGFRPFVWELAHRHRLAGTVCNTSGSVLIEVEGAASVVDAFAAELRAHPPRLARITAVEDSEVALRGEDGFRIVESLTVEGEYQPVSPDAATCVECLAEILDPAQRRHRYPFTNCTACGPRFTIIEGLPYDRPRTTMRDFPMCDACRAEYDDPADRRFHAQPVACADCGPRLWLAAADGAEVEGDAISLAAAALRAGEVVALRGLGGFQLACDATDAAAVARLRERKRRPAKPFAVMVTDLAAAQELCVVGGAEAAILEGSARPVLLLRRRADSSAIAGEVAPRVADLGLMLPYTPLHHLLLREVGRPLVMTSGNVTEEPIAKDNGEALERLRGIADRFLLHDRGIAARYDDSVSRVVAGEERLVRRARGHCPLPAPLAGVDTGVLALGAHLKNTFCVLRGGDAFVGPHIGDLDHPLTLRHQEESLSGCLRLLGARPEQLACDATDAAAVARLRERKRRPAKPFAVMVTDLAAAQELCVVGGAEAAILEGSARPVLLLRRRADSSAIAGEVAPRVADLGLMLPYTPLHHLLLREVGRPLVMTSGNVTEEPIAKDNGEALERLRGIADRFLLHDRGIAARYDDSVSRVVAGEERLVRRARGHCPLPAPLAGVDTGVLALGAHLKNTFCVLRGGDAFVGPHIGDLDHPLTLRHQEESLSGCLRLLGARPEVVACDLHPDYASTALAERRAAEWSLGEPVRVQHHHAHV